MKVFYATIIEILDSDGYNIMDDSDNSNSNANSGGKGRKPTNGRKGGGKGGGGKGGGQFPGAPAQVNGSGLEGVGSGSGSRFEELLGEWGTCPTVVIYL